MRIVRLAAPTDVAGWRAAARTLVAERAPPESVRFVVGEASDLFGEDARCETSEAIRSPAAIADRLGGPPRGDDGAPLRVPKAFVELAQQAALHRDDRRFDLLYRLLWRLRAEPGLLDLAGDPDVARLNAFAKAVRRDIHKTHAFVRFRRVEHETGEAFVAWHEPDHHVIEAAAPFFARRFAGMAFAILSPGRCAVHTPGEGLAFGPGAERANAPEQDELEELWRRYYASTFNPARPKPGMMKREMPVRFWKNLPEAQLIAPLLQDAERRAQTMMDAPPTTPVLRRGADWSPEIEPMTDATTLDTLRAQARACRLCPLWEPATQTVFGEGGADARIMFVGEQPGDQEDLAGKPFVGPAGQLFDRALREAGVDRRDAYVTNAVKHFKFEPRGKRRIHKKPSVGEIRACSTWLEREIELVRPRLIVMLGASAAQAVLRRTVTIGRERGRGLDMGEGRQGFVTTHPSFILRLPDEASKAQAYADFVDDLRTAGTLAAARPQAA